MEEKTNNNGADLKSNFIYNMAYRICTIIVPLITTPYISRVLGAENTGIYSYTYTIAWYFVIAGCFGFENYGNRQIAMVKDEQGKLNRTWSELFGLQLLTSCIAIVGYIIYYFFFCTQYRIYTLISGFYVISALFNITWLFYGLEQFKSTALRTIAIRFAGLFLILAFVKTEDDLWKYCFILAFMEFLNQLILWFRVNRYVSFVRVSFRDCLSHLKGCATLFVPIILINIYRMMDKLMLGNMSTMAEVGYYTYADKIVEMPFHVITAVGTVMLPRMTSMVAKGEVEKSRKYIKNTMFINTIFTSAFAFGMIAVSEDFSVLFFGSDYTRCAELIDILALMLIVRGWANVGRTQFLMPNHRDKEYIISLVIGVILNLVLNALTIPRIGAAGAALATLVAECSVAITQLAFTNKDLPIRKYLIPTFPFVAFGLLMLGIVVMIGNQFNLHYSWLGLLIQIAVGAVFYMVLCFIYLQKYDKNLLRSLIKRK